MALQAYLKKFFNDHNFLSLAANFSTAVMGLLSFMILLRMLSVPDLGKWILFTTPASLVDMLRYGLTRDALVRFLTTPDENKQKSLLGSSWIVGLVLLVAISSILWVIYLIIPNPLKSSGYDLFFLWYPVLALANIPWNYAWSILQSELDFKKIFWIRFFNLCSFLLIIYVFYLSATIHVTQVVLIYIATNLFTSLFCLARKWTGLQFLRHYDKISITELLNFGRYSMFTRIGSSLLKGADSFIISFSAYCGPTGVALYAIPLKFIELIEIPLISFATTAYPKLSKASIENKITEFRRIFYSYTGSIIYLFIAFAVLSFFLKKYFILFLGGANYHSSLEDLALIITPFIVYSTLLPLDRFTGISLDALNKPHKNLIKLIFMASFNVIGDIIVIFGFHALFPTLSVTMLLFFVAIVSCLFAIGGIIIGYYYLYREVKISFLTIFSSGYHVYNDWIKRIIPIDKHRSQ